MSHQYKCISVCARSHTQLFAQPRTRSFIDPKSSTCATVMLTWAWRWAMMMSSMPNSDCLWARRHRNQMAQKKIDFLYKEYRYIVDDDASLVGWPTIFACASAAGWATAFECIPDFYLRACGDYKPGPKDRGLTAMCPRKAQGPEVWWTTVDGGDAGPWS